MGKLIYLAHYCDLKTERKNSPAAVAVMDYVIESLNKIGHRVTVISPVQLTTRETRKRQTVQVNEKTTCIYTPTLRKAKRYNLPFRALQKYRRERNLLKELERTVEDGDTLLVYHSLSLMNAVKWINGRKKINVVLQVGEVYSDVLKNVKEKDRNKEREYISEADCYIFMSELLAEKFCGSKPYAVCSGVCKCVPKNTENRLNDDDKIDVVYSGTLNPEKGCLLAIKACEFLSEQYRVHILAFGSRNQIEEAKVIIAEISEETHAQVTYNGVLFGDEYSQFMQSCDIGLSPQNPNASFNETSFPSKILNYLSLGLRVVSIRLPAIEKSALNPYICYYDEQNPEELAKAIMSIDMSQPYDSYAIVERLDREFCEKLKELLGPLDESE